MAIKNKSKHNVKNKNKKENKKSKIDIYKCYAELTNIEFKRNFKRDLSKILVVAGISLIFVFFNFNSKRIININPNKVSEIVLINCFTKESGKKMIISQNKDIIKICDKLSTISKVSKKEIVDESINVDNYMYQNVYEIEDSKSEKDKYKSLKDKITGNTILDKSASMIIEIKYKNEKNENKILKINNNILMIDDRSYRIRSNNIQNMWYTFNEKVEEVTSEELRKYNN